jgi:hypothetical protein
MVLWKNPLSGGRFWNLTTRRWIVLDSGECLLENKMCSSRLGIMKTTPLWAKITISGRWQYVDFYTFIHKGSQER